MSRATLRLRHLFGITYVSALACALVPKLPRIAVWLEPEIRFHNGVDVSESLAVVFICRLIPSLFAGVFLWGIGIALFTGRWPE